MTRYSRQTSLPEIGEDGQEKLHKARVLIVAQADLVPLSPSILQVQG